MAAVTRTSVPSIVTLDVPHANKHGGNLYAGMALGTMDACYIHTDGKVYQSLDTGASTLCARVHGFNARKANANDPVTLLHGIEVAYTDASGMTPGALLYLSGSVAGGLDTAATNSHAPVGQAVNDQIAHLRKLLF